MVVAQVFCKRMYTLEQLRRKNLTELKEIGYELNVLPEGDRRRRESWIDAIAGVNPPLLALLEVSPAGEVSAEYPIIETVENSPGVGVEPVQEAPLESKFGRIVYPKSAAKPIAQNEEAIPQLDRIEGAGVHNLGFHPTKSDRDSSGAKTEALGSQEGDRILAVSRDCETDRGRVLPHQSIKLVNLTDEAARLENEPIMSQSAIAQVAENSPGAEVSFSDRQRYWADRGFFLIPEAPAEPAENSAVELFDGCPYCTLPEYESWHDETYGCYICEPEPDQIPIAQATENSPGAEIEQVQDWLPECCECFGDGYIEDESGLIKYCQCNTAEQIREKTQRAIAPEAKISLNPQSDRNPFLTGMCLSGRFLACYSPPQSESLHFKIPDGYKVL